MGCGIDEIGVAKETCVKPHGRSVESGDEDLWMGIKALFTSISLAKKP